MKNYFIYLKLKFVLKIFFGIDIYKDLYFKTIEKQYQKGLKKYNQTLQQCDYDMYDWDVMALEEAIDLQAYSEKKKSKI